MPAFEINSHGWPWLNQIWWRGWQQHLMRSFEINSHGWPWLNQIWCRGWQRHLMRSFEINSDRLASRTAIIVRPPYFQQTQSEQHCHVEPYAQKIFHSISPPFLATSLDSHKDQKGAWHFTGNLFDRIRNSQKQTLLQGTFGSYCEPLLFSAASV
jgi:hypothetical protein